MPPPGVRCVCACVRACVCLLALSSMTRKWQGRSISATEQFQCACHFSHLLHVLVLGFGSLQLLVGTLSIGQTASPSVEEILCVHGVCVLGV